MKSLPTNGGNTVYIYTSQQEDKHKYMGTHTFHIFLYALPVALTHFSTLQMHNGFLETSTFIFATLVPSAHEVGILNHVLHNEVQ